LKPRNIKRNNKKKKFRKKWKFKEENLCIENQIHIEKKFKKKVIKAGRMNYLII